MQINTPDGRRLTIQPSSLPLYERRGCTEVTPEQLAAEAIEASRAARSRGDGGPKPSARRRKRKPAPDPEPTQTPVDSTTDNTAEEH